MTFKEQLISLLRRGDWQAAQKVSLQRLESDSADHVAWYFAGVCAHQMGHHDIAIQRLQKAVKLDEKNPDYHNNLGVALAHAGQISAAIEKYEQTLQLAPERIDTLYNIANAHYQAGQANRAIGYLNTLLQLQPGAINARLLLAQCHLLLGKIHNASELLSGLLSDAEIHPQLWNEIGNGLVQCEQLEQAKHCYQQAIKSGINQSQALNNLGSLLTLMGNPEEGIRQLKHALTINDGDAETLSNLACAYDAYDESDMALLYHRRALEVAPQNPHFNLNYAIHLLRAGEIARSLPHYRYRFDHPAWASELKILRTVADVRMDEQFLSDTLVIGEQGLGDEIYLMQCLSQLMRPEKWFYMGDRRLMQLFERSFPEAEFIPRETENLESAIKRFKQIWRFDHVLSCLDQLDKKSSGAILKADDSRISHWCDYFNNLDSSHKVGISWTGGKHLKNRIRREVPTRCWSEFRNISGISFIDIQYDLRQDEHAEIEQTLGQPFHRPYTYDPLRNPDDACAMLMALDLIITVDNSTAHLAGALGAKPWIILGKVPDWRWGTRSYSSVPYPGIHIYRQQEFGDWKATLLEIANDLVTYTNNYA